MLYQSNIYITSLAPCQSALYLPYHFQKNKQLQPILCRTYYIQFYHTLESQRRNFPYYLFYKKPQKLNNSKIDKHYILPNVRINTADNISDSKFKFKRYFQENNKHIPCIKQVAIFRTYISHNYQLKFSQFENNKFSNKTSNIILHLLNAQFKKTFLIKIFQPFIFMKKVSLNRQSHSISKVKFQLQFHAILLALLLLEKNKPSTKNTHLLNKKAPLFINILYQRFSMEKSNLQQLIK
eukprot:TRINITY_DN6815_c0_g1_i8.p1 TRINITY_DN6815_c0_g1~~TRINITY_DN6815_c0_g1_i8.p1  ORF type:complete len:238 (+),score=-11.91 TRINITY_DN6815_c0_g1_i8:303-1016(+)